MKYESKFPSKGSKIQYNTRFNSIDDSNDDNVDDSMMTESENDVPRSEKVVPYDNDSDDDVTYDDSVDYDDVYDDKVKQAYIQLTLLEADVLEQVRLHLLDKIKEHVDKLNYVK